MGVFLFGQPSAIYSLFFLHTRSLDLWEGLFFLSSSTAVTAIVAIEEGEKLGVLHVSRQLPWLIFLQYVVDKFTLNFVLFWLYKFACGRCSLFGE